MLKRNFFLLFLIGIIFSTMLDCFNEFFIIWLCLSIIGFRKELLSKIKIKQNIIIYFVLYYLLISCIGCIFNYLTIKDLIEFILKYCVLPIYIFFIIPKEKEKIDIMMYKLKNFIFICAIYGFFEGIMKYNFLNEISVNKINMSIINGYKCHSIFLHYNYYGIILAIGWIISYFYKYKNSILEKVFLLVIIEQIFACQSRIIWIFFVFINIYYYLKKNNIKKTRLKELLIFLIIGILFLIFNVDVFNKLKNFITGRFYNIFKYGFNDGSLGQRIGTLLNFKEYFKNNAINGFFGTGYNSIATTFLKDYSFFKGYSTADCQYTVFLVETGIIGTLIFFLSFIICFYKKILIKKMFLLLILFTFLTLDIVQNNIILSIYYAIILIEYNKYIINKYDKKEIDLNES